tara:strand:+ start:111 stop:305 length:195 start_codon:yes stop_codon:yes gene_type:complete
MSDSPPVFYLVATSPIDPSDVREEEFHRGIYVHEADRIFEASQWSERMLAKGFTVTYEERDVCE